MGLLANHQNVVVEWQANSPGDLAAGASFARVLIRIDWPQFNNNGGDITMGPDGLLYIPTGDGGGAEDLDGDLSMGLPSIGHSGNGNAQKLTVPLGKILRIDPDGNNSANGRYGIPADNPFVTVPGAIDEIYAYGLRSPYGMSFDSESGALVTGDIGQNDLEEVDVIVKGGHYGRSHKEGTPCFQQNIIFEGFATLNCPPNLPPNLVDPIAQYDNDTEGEAVVGGFVYHGGDFSQLAGRYVFGDYSRIFTFPNGPDNYGRLLYLQEQGLTGSGLREIKEFQGFAEEASRIGLTNPSQPPAQYQQTMALLGFAQDGEGEIYVLGNRTGRQASAGTGGFIVKLVEPA